MPDSIRAMLGARGANVAVITNANERTRGAIKFHFSKFGVESDRNGHTVVECGPFQGEKGEAWNIMVLGRTEFPELEFANTPVVEPEEGGSSA